MKEENNKGFKYLEDFTKKQENFLSVIDFNNIETQLTPDYFQSKLPVEFEYSIYEGGKFNLIEVIFKTKSNFFVYLSKTDKWDSYYHIKIFYEPHVKDEVSFLIRSLNKKII